MFSESAQLIVFIRKKQKNKPLSYLFLRVLMPVPISVSHVHGFLQAEFHHCRIPGSQSSFFCSRSADLRFCLFFCTGVGRTTALQTGSSSPGCHGSWKLLRGVCRNPHRQIVCAGVFVHRWWLRRDKGCQGRKKSSASLTWKYLMCIDTQTQWFSAGRLHTRPTHRFKGFFFFSPQCSRLKWPKD